MNCEVQSLVTMAEKGDIEAFELLIEGFEKKVFNMALKAAGDHDRASELAQEIFISAYKTIKNLEDEAFFSIWLLRIAADACIKESAVKDLQPEWGLKSDVYRRCSGI